MNQKLDPNLQAIVEKLPEGASADPVQVIVGLAAPASEVQLEALRHSGLQVRSVIGDVLTGSAKLEKISEIAEHGVVKKIEASSPLFPE